MKKRRQQDSAAKGAGIMLERPAKQPVRHESDSASPAQAVDAAAAAAPATEVAKRSGRVILGYDRRP